MRRAVEHSILEHPTSRFLSQEEAVALTKRASSFARGGGDTSLRIEGTWSGFIRYARNRVTTSGDVRDNTSNVIRNINGAIGSAEGNRIDDVGLETLVRNAERMLQMYPETGGDEFTEHLVRLPEHGETVSPLDQHMSRQDREAALTSLVQTEEEYAKPKLFFDSTYNFDADARASTIVPLIDTVRTAGMVAAGYIEVNAVGRAVMDTEGHSLYYPYTTAEYSVTVRDPNGQGSGWAGVDWGDWTRVNPAALSRIALDKCLRSRNPVAVEPGRYTTILEPQAVCDFVAPLVGVPLSREAAESGNGPFAGAKKGTSKLGQKVLDERITISADPMDPDLGFPPFSLSGDVYHPAVWITKGMLTDLWYNRRYAIRELGKNTGLPNSRAFRMSGGSSSIDDMIATTKRGLLVTRFSDIVVEDPNSLVTVGYTRDGLWLIENGKISKPVKNFHFRESPMFALNNVDMLGTPVRTYHPGAPVVVPPLKVRDFNFVSLSDAI
jgi:predicted Zn-dependent protease